MPKGWRLVPLVPLVGALVLADCGIRKPDTPCEWVVQNSSISLLNQIKRAEDISIRHSDAKPYGQVRRDAREQCEAKLFAAIAASRTISVDAVREARRELDHRGFDWLVNVPMALFTLVAGVLMTRAARRRFPDDHLPRIAAIVLLSVGLGVFVIGIGQLWAFTVEGIRIGNDHLSYRGLRIPWGKHRGMTFVLAMFAMWVIAAMPALGTHFRHPRHPGTNP